MSTNQILIEQKLKYQLPNKYFKGEPVYLGLHCSNDTDTLLPRHWGHWAGEAEVGRGPWEPQGGASGIKDTPRRG